MKKTITILLLHIILTGVVLCFSKPVKTTYKDPFGIHILVQFDDLNKQVHRIWTKKFSIGKEVVFNE